MVDREYHGGVHFGERMRREIKELAIAIVTGGAESKIPDWFVEWRIATTLFCPPWDLFDNWRNMSENERKEKGAIILHGQAQAEMLVQEKQQEEIKKAQAAAVARGQGAGPRGLVVPQGVPPNLKG